MLTKSQLLDEARKQKQALSVMGRWRNWLFILTSCFAVLAASGLRQSGFLFALGVTCVVLTVVCFLAALTVNLSIRNGRRNVERLLEALE